MATGTGTGPEPWVTLGRIGRVHGIRGWVKLQSYTDPAENLTGYRHFTVHTVAGPLMLEMDEIRPQGNSWIAHFSGYDSPEKSRELTGQELMIASGDLPELARDEYYWHQLQGLAVVNLAGENLGRVVKMMETGANDVMVVQGTEASIDQRERLLPYRWQHVVKSVGLTDGRITVDWPAHFLA